MIAPTVTVVFLAVLVPILWLVFISFRDLRLRDLREVGIFGGSFTFANVIDAVTARGFFEALTTTLVYSVVGTLLAVALGLVAALVVRDPFPGRSLVRGIMLMPYVAPVVAVTFVWSVMLDPNLGIINTQGIEVLGWDRAIPFLSLRTTEVNFAGATIGLPVALLTVIGFQVWRYFPFAFLFVLARLQAVPLELEEAARVDGATPLQRFRHITFPQLRPVLTLLIVLRLIWTFNEFDDIYLLTGGGAGTEVVSVRVFNYLLGRGNIGTAAALSLVLALSLAGLLGLYFRSSREERA